MDEPRKQAYEMEPGQKKHPMTEKDKKDVNELVEIIGFRLKT